MKEPKRKIPKTQIEAINNVDMAARNLLAAVVEFQQYIKVDYNVLTILGMAVDIVVKVSDEIAAELQKETEAGAE